MEFQDAIQFKNQLNNNTIIEGGYTMRIFITPCNKNDVTRYFDDFRSGHFDDEVSKKYSTNGQFAVYAIWTDGIEIVYKPLLFKTLYINNLQQISISQSLKNYD